MKNTLCIVALGLFTQAVLAQDTLTVERAVQRVLQTHPALEQAAANIRAAEARTALSQSAAYPDVSALAQYTRIGPIPSVIFGTANFLFAPDNNYDGHVTAQYTVYDFGRTSSGVDIAQSRVQSTRDAAELTRTGLALLTIRTFYTIVFLEKSLTVQDEQIAALQLHLDISQKRVLAGSSTKFDVLTTQVRVASAQNQRVEIQNALDKQQSILRQLLGLPAHAPIVVNGAFGEEHLTLDADAFIQTANDRRPELKMARDAEQTAQLQRQLSSINERPSLKVFGSYGVKNGYEPNLDAWRGNWAVGAVAAVPIFNGNRTEYQVEESKAALEAEQAHTSALQKQIRSEVEQAIADVLAAETKVEISKVQLQQAHEAVVIARTRYETGSITNLDLLDAETAESTSKLSDLQALYQYVISKYNLQQATGELLKQVNG
jgi:outer membrane protein TolC